MKTISTAEYKALLALAEAADNAGAWLIEAREGTDQHERGLEVMHALKALAIARNKPQPEETPVIVVYLDGGLVRDVYSDAPASFIVVDTDTDCCGEDDVCPVPFAMEKYMDESQMFKPRHCLPVTVDPEAVQEVVNIQKQVSAE